MTENTKLILLPGYEMDVIIAPLGDFAWMSQKKSELVLPPGAPRVVISRFHVRNRSEIPSSLQAAHSCYKDFIREITKSP